MALERESFEAEPQLKIYNPIVIAAEMTLELNRDKCEFSEIATAKWSLDDLPMLHS
jgi:hypothetical protein